MKVSNMSIVPDFHDLCPQSRCNGIWALWVTERDKQKQKFKI